MTDTTRREVLAGAALGGVALTPLGALAQEGGDTAMSDAFTYEVDLSEAEWRARLTPEQFHVLRDWGTEERFSSDYAAGSPRGISAAKDATSRSTRGATRSSCPSAGCSSPIRCPTRS